MNKNRFTIFSEGNTTKRPLSPCNGYQYWNTDIDRLEVFYNNIWLKVYEVVNTTLDLNFPHCFLEGTNFEINLPHIIASIKMGDNTIPEVLSTDSNIENIENKIVIFPDDSPYERILYLTNITNDIVIE